MKLSPYEEDMLIGKKGPASRMAMEIIVRLGELYGAEELLPISQAHIDGGLYAAVGEAGLDFAEKLHQLGGRVAVPTSMNATSRDIASWPRQRVGADFAEKNRRMEQAYLGMGVVPTWTCAPYQVGLIPRFGEQIAWAESNAIVYVNSVIGARTERYGDYTDICCALTGRVPKFGLHLTENRRGQMILHCEKLSLTPRADQFALLGYLTGYLANDQIPVLTGIPDWVTPDHLKAFCAAVASSGAVAMFHMVGITPEAPDLKSSLQGQSPKETIVLTNEMLNEAKEKLCHLRGNRIDGVLIGCPHASAPEIMEIARLVAGKKVAPDKKFWIFTSHTAYHWLEQTDVLGILTESGIKIFRDTCFVNTDLSGWNFKQVMTNSAKYAHYMPSRTGLGVIFADLEQCINTALTPGEIF
ncbi:MAG: aconitase X [Bacillota bacterium]|jgi:predicted aconitase